MSRKEITTKDDLIKVIELLEKTGITYWLDGGWGVDVLAGRQTRTHRDIDIDFDAQYMEKLLDMLLYIGYKIDTDWKPVRIELYRRTKWKNREKWICPNGCKNDKYISDVEVFGGILSAIGMAATQSDALLSKEEVVTYYPTQEIMRYTNEIGRMTNQPAPSFMAGKKVILECAALKFQACRENKAAAYTEFVRRKVEQEFESGKVSMDFLTVAVSQVKIYKDGAIGVVFVNGAEVIGKKEGVTNAAKGRNKNRSESAVGKAK